MHDTPINKMLSEILFKDYQELHIRKEDIDSFYIIKINPDIVYINIHKLFSGLEDVFTAKETDKILLDYGKLLYKDICKGIMLCGLDNNSVGIAKNIVNLVNESFMITLDKTYMYKYFISNDEMINHCIKYVTESISLYFKDLQIEYNGVIHDIFTLEDRGLNRNCFILSKLYNNYSIGILKMQE